MKSRLTLIFSALTVLLGAMVWVVNDRPGVATVPVMAVEPVAAVPVAPGAGPAAPTAVQTVASAAAAPAAPATRRNAPPTARIDASGEVTYVARPGDTVSELADAMLGSDAKANRDAVIAASPSLQSNPDRVLAGQTYTVAPSPNRTARPEGTNDRRDDDAADEGAPRAEAAAEGSPSLEYTAQPGDTVRGLAADLLGGDTTANRRAIVAGNASLRQNPDHLVAGQSYTIVARNGLAADPEAPPVKFPTTQPDADEAARLSVGRMLSYTAKPGDTVSRLATVLLGSDTRANRELILRSNYSLKQNPDRLVAGVTYWVAAPVPAAKPVPATKP